MTLEPAETEAATESSWVDAVADDLGEMTQAVLAQGVRLAEQNDRIAAKLAEQNERLAEIAGRDDDKRLDAVETAIAVQGEKMAGLAGQFGDLKARLDRPSGFERAFEATAAGMGKVLDNKPAVVLALLLLAGLAGVVIDTPWGKVGASGDDDTATPLAQDDDDGGGDVDDGGTDNESDAIAFPR